MDRKEELEIEEKIEKSKDTVINAIAETMDLYGVTNSIARLYGTMYFHKNAISLDEMKNELGMSKPSMSKAVRTLSENNLVKKVWQKGSRKDFYLAEKDFFKYFATFFCEKWNREVRINLEAISMVEENLKDVLKDSKANETIKEEAKYYCQQLEKSKEYYFWLERLSESVKSGDIFKYIPIKSEEY
ncbi:choline uptake/conversion transcriptional regulator CudC [Anaerophilus nitritogenes]|uniref:choline uptake/conversion transcriptional regulator CudC n=1 Tax=Anaerophilus nitritogenes TaxID=2498136 RepID=UPI00101DF9CC|nr:GbsR/MarR family transcriptional regulator [Anaerophilus nitritogenes]